MKLSGRKITSWDDPSFDRDEEYGNSSRNARGKRRVFVKSFRKQMNRKLRYDKTYIDENS